jgi:hypothetical protein
VDIGQATKLVHLAISDILKKKTKISGDMQLIGGESLLDSIILERKLETTATITKHKDRR